MGGQLGSFSPLSIQAANRGSVNLVMLPLGNTEVIVDMNFLRDYYLNLDLNPQFAHMVHAPANQKQVLIAQLSEPLLTPISLKCKGLIRGGREQAPPCLIMICYRMDNSPFLLLK